MSTVTVQRYGFSDSSLTSDSASIIEGSTPMAPPSKFSFSFSKFPEGGLILAIVVLGLLLAIFGGSVQLPKFQNNAGKQERVFETGPDGQKTPAFVTVNKFFNPRTLIQIAKDTSFFAIMAVGMTFVIITGGIDLSVGATYALASVCGALVLAQFGGSGGLGAVLIGILVTIGIGVLGGFLNGCDDCGVQRSPVHHHAGHDGHLSRDRVRPDKRPVDRRFPGSVSVVCSAGIQWSKSSPADRDDHRHDYWRHLSRQDGHRPKSLCGRRQ